MTQSKLFVMVCLAVSGAVSVSAAESALSALGPEGKAIETQIVRVAEKQKAGTSRGSSNASKMPMFLSGHYWPVGRNVCGASIHVSANWLKIIHIPQSGFTGCFGDEGPEVYGCISNKCTYKGKEIEFLDNKSFRLRITKNGEITDEYFFEREGGA